MSVKCLSVILGPEMAAPILWAPRISAFFLLFWVGGGGSADFIFMGAGIFLIFFETRNEGSENFRKISEHFSQGGANHEVHIVN